MIKEKSVRNVKYVLESRSTCYDLWEFVFESDQFENAIAELKMHKLSLPNWEVRLIKSEWEVIDLPEET